jgi:hypothetical protein
METIMETVMETVRVYQTAVQGSEAHQDEGQGERQDQELRRMAHPALARITGQAEATLAASLQASKAAARHRLAEANRPAQTARFLYD